MVTPEGLEKTREAPITGGILPSETHPVRAEILQYLARHGSSRITAICDGIGAGRNSIQYHLTVLESAGIVGSDLPATERARRTPFYTLITR